MFVRQGLWLTGIGIVFGLAAAFLSMRLMSSLLFGVSPMDPGTYILVFRSFVLASPGWPVICLRGGQPQSIRRMRCERSNGWPDRFGVVQCRLRQHTETQ